MSNFIYKQTLTVHIDSDDDDYNLADDLANEKIKQILRDNHIKHIDIEDKQDFQVDVLNECLNPLELKSISLINNNILYITSLEQFYNLTSLHLDNNNISDITPLSNLRNLYFLYLDHNIISDVGPLKHHTKLDCLSLNNNQLVDVSPLWSIRDLREVYLNNNQIQNIIGLPKSVQHLDVSFNKLTRLIPDIFLKRFADFKCEGNTLLEEIDLMQVDFILYKYDFYSKDYHSNMLNSIFILLSTFQVKRLKSGPISKLPFELIQLVRTVLMDYNTFRVRFRV
jgi:Leucine-rich repeat (LRR) protein